MVIALLAALGLIFGSFVNALVWRVHEQSKTRSARKKAALSMLHGRSMCPHCHHALAVTDLVPVLSWVWLKGKCRYCHRPIAWHYPVVEIIMSGLFVWSYLFWPLSFQSSDSKLQFILWLALLVGFVALAVYDLRWMLLPNRIVYPLFGLVIGLVLVSSLGSSDGWMMLSGAAWGFLIVGGFFYLLFQVSKGKWIGGGDVKLGALLGLLVRGPANALLLLFLASLAGCLVAIPLMLLGKANRSSRLPFGPFLLVAAVLTYLFGSAIIAGYQHLFLTY